MSGERCAECGRPAGYWLPSLGVWNCGPCVNRPSPVQGGAATCVHYDAGFDDLCIHCLGTASSHQAGKVSHE